MKQGQLNVAERIAVRESRQRDEAARLALEAARTGLWEIRPLSGEHFLSARSRELLGIEADEPISIGRLLAALHPADRGRWNDAVAGKQNRESRFEFRTAVPTTSRC